MPSHYKRTEIPESMKDLFEKDLFEKGKNRTYRFRGSDGEIQECDLARDEELVPLKCPVDGCFLVEHSADPHTVVDCPCCGQYFSPDGFSPKEYEAQLRRETTEIEKRLQRNKGLLAMLTNPTNLSKSMNFENTEYKGK